MTTLHDDAPNDLAEMITEPVRPGPAVRHLTLFGAVAVAFCALSMGLLHVMPSGRGLSPVSTPLSDYARTSAAWLFDMSVLILVTGVAAVLASAVDLSTSLPIWP